MDTSFHPSLGPGTKEPLPPELCLNGEWDCGVARDYTRRVRVPGLAGDPTRIDAASIWYRRRVRLPEGGWTGATLILNGARFAPRVYVDRVPVSSAAGGMAATEHPLASTSIRPGASVEIEVELQPLDRVPADDASLIPEADRWRSNVSACLWDKVVLRFHHAERLVRVLPSYDIHQHVLKVGFETTGDADPAAPSSRLVVALETLSGALVAHRAVDVGTQRQIALKLDGSITRWTPEHPQLYHLRVELWCFDQLADRREIKVGMREFKAGRTGFFLNGEPVVLRAASVAWHRWVRDPESGELAFDADWFERNIVKRLKAYGANTLRFHLGMPPEELLDLCDRHGLLVQAEWIFFHGLKASEASMVEQWRAWLDLCVRHPSTAIIHAWNETLPEELAVAWAALDCLLPEYPPLVIGHRDVIHLHKYWWSLFENLGLYYDSAEQFPLPIMADEFGGNYLDGAGNPGGYPMLRESFPRFLGPDSTPQDRLAFQALANGKVAEYWRRLGAAGFSPFCALGPPEDGNHWFVGPIAEAREKPVWAALAAAWASRSVSLELWDRNYRPGQRIEADVVCFNDTDAEAEFRIGVAVLDPTGRETSGSGGEHRVTVPPHGRHRLSVCLVLPDETGDWLVRAELLEGSVSDKPIRSDWAVRTWRPAWRAAPPKVPVGVPAGEEELRAFLASQGVLLAAVDDPTAAAAVTGRITANQLETGGVLPNEVLAALRSGKSWLALDLGPTPLGQGYGEDLGPLQAAPEVAEPVTHVRRLDDIEVHFQEAPEPESHLHPVAEAWGSPVRPASLHWLWNGLRGGLVVPACTFEIGTLGRESFKALWESRGADAVRWGDAPCFAFELSGFFAFSARKDDSEVVGELRRRVRFLVDDAPSLAVSIDPEAPIQVTDLLAAYQAAPNTGVSARALAHCGKALLRTPVWEVTRRDRPGRWVLSQALTAGRLRPIRPEPGLYGRREDPAAAQFVLDLLVHLLGAPVAAAAPH